jgi:hypothetical protein
VRDCLIENKNDVGISVEKLVGRKEKLEREGKGNKRKEIETKNKQLMKKQEEI